MGIESTGQWLWVQTGGFEGWINAGLTRGNVNLSQLPIIED